MNWRTSKENAREDLILNVQAVKLILWINVYINIKFEKEIHHFVKVYKNIMLEKEIRRISFC